MYKNSLTANELSIHEPLESWNVILETSIGSVSKTSSLMTKICLCKCPNVSIINLNIVPNLYKICIQSWSKLLELIQLCNNDIVTILKNIYIL